MKNLSIIIVAILAIFITVFVFILSISELEAPTIGDINIDADNSKSNEIDSIISTNDDLLVFENYVLGIRFSYPKEWGELTTLINEQKVTFSSYYSQINDLKSWRKEALVAITDIGAFLSSYTTGDAPGRGGYWADSVVLADDAKQIRTLCSNLDNPEFGVQPQESCVTFQNIAGIEFAQLHGDVDWYGEVTKNVDLYLANHPDSDYYGVAFTTQGFAIDGEVSQEIADEMYETIMSLEYITK